MNKTALITGGSSGLGLALALRLAGEGYDLFLLARRLDKLERAKQQIAAKCPTVTVTCLVCDVSDEQAVQRSFEEVRRVTPKLDFLILNAGVATINLLRDYEDVSIITRNLQTNLMGVLSTAYFGMPLLQAGSRLLFVSSGFAYVGPAGYSLYATAKAGINNFAEAMRRELLARQVQVHLACPGDIDTPMYQGELEIMPEWMKGKMGRAKPMSAGVVARYILERCFKNHFLIIPSADVRWVLIMQRLLPRKVAMWIVDRLLPLPTS